MLVELGASTPTRGLYLIDRDFADPAVLDPWLALARAQVAGVLGAGSLRDRVGAGTLEQVAR